MRTIIGKEIHFHDWHGATSVGHTGPGTMHSVAWVMTVSVVWMGTRGKVRLCLSVVCIFVLSERRTGRLDKCSKQCSNHVNWVHSPAWAPGLLCFDSFVDFDAVYIICLFTSCFPTYPFLFTFYSAPQCSHCKRCTSYSNSVCLSVRLSVALRYCVKMTARSTVQFALSDSKMCLVL